MAFARAGIKRGYLAEPGGKESSRITKSLFNRVKEGFNDFYKLFSELQIKAGMQEE
jgi:hypothetical protein